MPMLELSAIQQVVVLILPILFAITLHEAAHAFAAWRCGDNTAIILGRLSLNPARHIDFLGTIAVPILIFILSGFHFIFGWAKPVPIQSRHFKNMRRDLVFVSIAGPMANLIMALLWACVLKTTAMIGITYSLLQNPVIIFFLLTAKTGIIINLLFAFLNLIPILPLDGGRILSALLPYNWAVHYAKLEPYGFFILLALLLTNLLTWMILPPTEWVYTLIKSLFYI